MALQKNFYRRETLTVAKQLLGCFLMRKIGRKVIRARITEVEAYIGEDDLACHASKGRTKRTEIMYGEPGHAYVYMIYGMYHCLNIVTEKKGYPSAVLVRAVANSCEYVHKSREWREIHGVKTDGPGKLCRFLKIDKKLNGWDMTKGEKLWIDRPTPRLRSGEKVIANKRIGVDYAKHCRDYLWRFSLDYSK